MDNLTVFLQAVWIYSCKHPHVFFFSAYALYHNLTEEY